MSLTMYEIKRVLELEDDFLQLYHDEIKKEHKDKGFSDLVIELADTTLTQGHDAARKIVRERTAKYIYEMMSRN